MTRRVFDEPAVRREHGLSPAEPEVAWFTKVSRPEAAAGRRVVNDLFSRYPDVSEHTWTRLHSENDGQFLSALDELYVYDLLAKRYTVGYEEGDGKHPDFHLYRSDEHVGRVEVLTLLQRDEWSAEERRHAQLADLINQRLPLTTHSVIFDIQRWGSFPSVNDLAAWLSSAIAELAAQPVVPGGDPISPEEPVRTYSRHGTEIEFEFLPLPPGYHITADDNAVVGGACTGGLIDTATRLRRRLKTKASKYPRDGQPYAIVVGARDQWCDIGEIHRALTGTSAIVERTGEVIRRGDGFYGVGRDHPQGKHRHVSAVYSLHDWSPGGSRQPRITRFDNPFATALFPDDALPFSGHWGVAHRDAARVRADWLIPAERPLEVLSPGRRDARGGAGGGSSLG